MPRGSVSPYPKRNAKIYEMWNEGLRGTEIGRKFGMTRSAVIGVVHRAPAGVITRTIADFVPKPKAKPIPRITIAKVAAPIPVPDVAPVLLGAPGDLLDSGCKFIEGDPLNGGRMCGCAVHKRGSSWCAHHYKNYVRNPVQPKARKQNDRTHYSAGTTTAWC